MLYSWKWSLLYGFYVIDGSVMKPSRPTIDIPQEYNAALDGHKKVMYAKNQDGVFDRYTYGSQAEAFATQIAVQAYQQQMQACLAEIIAGRSSPIAYYMNQQRMDIATLSAYVGMYAWRVKRHLKMKPFQKLSDRILQRYAKAFDLSVDDLTHFNPQQHNKNEHS